MINQRKTKLIAIGASKGGIDALKSILPVLSADFGAAIGVVLHRGVDSTPNLERMLALISKVRVVEVEDGEAILPGRVYIAPPDYHLLADTDCFRLSLEKPVNYARPSIDVFFESVAFSHGESSVGVILTGMGKDGAKGLAAIKYSGGIAIVEDPAGAMADEMPKAAIIACSPAVIIMKLSEIGDFFLKIWRNNSRLQSR